MIAVIKAGNVRAGFISSTLSTLGDLNIPRVANFQDACISWIDEIIGSTYPEDDRYFMASSAVALLGERFDPPPSTEFSGVRAPVIRPLLNFLSLSEKFRPIGSPRRPEVIALQAIHTTAEHKYFDPNVLDVLTCTLLLTHPLRSLALRLFQQPGFEWCSSSTEAMDRGRLLEAVGDPFEFNTPGPTPLGEEPTISTSYQPMRTITLFVEFASSDLWKEHLHPSNFTSCEEKVSTQEGRSIAFGCMDERRGVRAGPFNSTARLILAVKRLEELGCWNTAEVVMAWAWTNVNANHDTHEATGREALIHCHLRGMQRRGVLSRHVQTIVPQSVRVLGGSSKAGQMGVDLTRLAQACHLKGLYQLFGCNSTVWEEVGAEILDDVSLGLNGARLLPP